MNKIELGNRAIKILRKALKVIALQHNQIKLLKWEMDRKVPRVDYAKELPWECPLCHHRRLVCPERKRHKPYDVCVSAKCLICEWQGSVPATNIDIKHTVGG